MPCLATMHQNMDKCLEQKIWRKSSTNVDPSPVPLTWLSNLSTIKAQCLKITQKVSFFKKEWFSVFLKLASLAQCFKTTFMRLLGWFSNTLSKVAFIRKSFITLFIWIMKSASSAGVLTTKPEQNIGLAEIHGALIGASLDFSALKCTRTTSASRRHVCGLCQGQARLFSPGFFFLHPNK